MSYEDLEEARAKRAEKEAAKEAKGKGKRGRKRKKTTPDADALEANASESEADASESEADASQPFAKMVRMSEAPARSPVVRMSGTPPEEGNIVPNPLRAPVARMW